MPTLTDEQITELNDLTEKAAAMQQEALGLNVQVVHDSAPLAAAKDHIGAAEALLAAYERSTAIALRVGDELGRTIEGESGLALVRHAAELHIKIANALNAGRIG